MSADEPTADLTIDALAHETGVPSRSIRYYQTRGLLPAPTVRGRTGFYDSRHVERLRLITELANEGLNLHAIGWLLAGASSVDSEELRGLKRVVLDGWVTDEPRTFPWAAIAAGFGVTDPDDPIIRRAIELELLSPGADARSDDWTVHLPTVLAAGTELRSMGADIGRALDVLATMREHALAVADAYVELFDESILGPWDSRGRPSEEFAAVRSSVERLRPLAGEALLAVFSQVMGEAVADRLTRQTPLDDPA